MKRTVLALCATAMLGAPAAVLATDPQRPGAGPTARERLDEAYRAYVQAHEALRAAEERRDHGIEPLPGERLGIAGGGSRLAPEYFERQKSLEREVALAQWQLDQTLRRWNALRR
jgi:hypothetical protein